MKNQRFAVAHLLLVASLLFVASGASSAFAHGVKPLVSEETNKTLHFSLIDLLPPERGTTAINSIEERRRLPVFNAALQGLVRDHKLPPSVLINNEPELRSGTSSERPQPPGTLIVRVFLTQWSQTRLGGYADTEILCRLYVEEVIDGRKVANFGPFFSSTQFDFTVAPTFQERIGFYQKAVRKSLEQLAAKLAVSPVSGKT